MSRIVKFTENKPLKLKTEDKTVFICQCGLSKKFPFCDGHHKKTLDEEEGKTYIYSEECRVEI